MLQRTTLHVLSIFCFLIGDSAFALPTTGKNLEFSCQFSGSDSGEPTCQAKGQFNSEIPEDFNERWELRSDGFTVTCLDSDTGQETLVYRDILGTQIRSSMDYLDQRIFDIRWTGKNINHPPFVDVDRFDWDNLSGVYSARLSYKKGSPAISGYCQVP